MRDTPITKTQQSHCLGTVSNANIHNANLNKTGRLGIREHFLLVLFVSFALVVTSHPASAAIPAVGEKAPDFSLSTLDGLNVQFQSKLERSLVVVVVRVTNVLFARNRLHDFIDHAKDFATRKATVLFVYPGPSGDLDRHAREFLVEQTHLPKNVILVTDPDYKMTNLYGLRRNAPEERAYPSTFIVDRTERFFSRRSVIPMEIARLHKMYWTSFQNEGPSRRPRTKGDTSDTNFLRNAIHW